jgi:hypothetical protein
MFTRALAFFAFIIAVKGGTIIVSTNDRNTYISQAISWFSESENSIENADMFNGPPNPYGLKNFETLECDFVEPDVNDPIGGTTPKFYCEFEYDGEKVQIKIKYDQQYNPLMEYGRANPEVYTSVISQRVLWATGFGSDQSVPINVICRDCPIEPWTYIQMIQGYDSEDILSGWIDMKLIESGRWNTKVPRLSLPSAIAYIKLNKYFDGDEIDYLDSNGTQHRGYFWPEMYSYPTEDSTQSTSRDALSVIAAFLSYCDNFDENQGFFCLKDSKSTSPRDTSQISSSSSDKNKCEGVPLLYIHDTGGTLGYGWNLRHKNFWPNYMDLAQVFRRRNRLRPLIS